jgi:hypothetical protein
MFIPGANLIEGHGFFEKNVCRRFERDCGELLYRMS